MTRRFEIMNANTRQYRRYNAVRKQITVRLIPRTENSDAVAHFLASVNSLFKYALNDVDDADMEGLTIQKQVNQNDSHSET